MHFPKKILLLIQEYTINFKKKHQKMFLPIIKNAFKWPNNSILIVNYSDNQYPKKYFHPHYYTWYYITSIECQKINNQVKKLTIGYGWQQNFISGKMLTC